ncbi:MAG: ATP-dependent sacrificial sulfur transferase LarE [Eubacterium sp.]|nr:ATP-dependent sacrificial sulfur transferase LarE [Eubacterium sp.]
MDIKSFFEKHGETALAFSGGVDSSVLLALSKKYAKRVKAYYVKSQFQPRFELDDALETAEKLGAELEVIELDVLGFNEIINNPPDRCYYCKKAIFGEILKHAKRDGFGVIIEGTNASDDISDRPGYKALGELEVLSPLKFCGYTKADIRRTAAEFGLSVADKPSYACLATRIPTGTVITDGLLKKTEAAENGLRALGFRNFRVRYKNGGAGLEFGKTDFELYYKSEDEVQNVLSPYYDKITLDLKERPDE